MSKPRYVSFWTQMGKGESRNSKVKMAGKGYQVLVGVYINSRGLGVIVVVPAVLVGLVGLVPSRLSIYKE